jgi:ABC-type hemin transport system ATPase subunit
MKIEFRLVVNGKVELCITPEDDFEKQMLKKVFSGDIKVESPPNSNDMVSITNVKKP